MSEDAIAIVFVCKVVKIAGSSSEVASSYMDFALSAISRLRFIDSGMMVDSAKKIMDQKRLKQRTILCSNRWLKKSACNPGSLSPKYFSLLQSAKMY